MSGPGDIDGEVSGDEAAWRDLIARFDVSADAETTNPPWPSSEDLPGPPVPGRGPAGVGAAGTGAAGTDPAGTDPAGTDPADTDRADTGPVETVDPALRRDHPGGLSGAYLPADRTRVIGHAGDPRNYSPPDEEDERYVPAPLPPPAKLDSVAKAAWVGVIGGPGYLLVVSLFLHMAVSPIAAFTAVAAFVAGFVTLIVKLGDHSRRDDDDDGAVL